MKLRHILISALLTLILAAPAGAHFGMIIPDANLVDRPGPVNLAFLFWHPMEGAGMNLAKPEAAFVFAHGQRQDILASLQAAKMGGFDVWRAVYQIKKPGDYYFVMEPKPYWEPAEDCFIIHYTKTLVSAMGAEEGWDQPVGLPMEILPFTRPYGLYGGNSFTGQVLFQGKPLAFCEVEVEHYNQDGKKAPSGSHITQVVKADANGVFTFAMPWKGWWGFAALHTDPGRKIKHEGQDKDIELGGVLWVHAH